MSRFPIPFGRHLLLERINVGGMAEVFKAKSFGVEGFERIVAVKRILPTLVEDDEFTTMFVDEARIVAQLTHQNIVQIYDLGKHEGTFYISMEYVAGRDLRAILDWQKKQRRPMEVAKACFVVSRVCEALEYAHRKRDPAGRDLKIIHRDVTPQNVILSYEGEVKLCDFGIAKAASRVSRTQVGVLKGKFAYMSPEQVRGQPIDRRSDVFALGVIFYEMLTGERLFLGESDYATLEAVRNAVIPPPRQFNPNISPGLERVMLRMLARDPRDRYQWAAEVHEDLLEHIVDQGRPYHSRHLRHWIQQVYARDIEVENAKLESFMELRLPPENTDEGPPAEVVEAVEAEHPLAPDPAEGPIEPERNDPTDHFPVQSAGGADLTYEDATDFAGQAAPRAGTDSPVSDLFGAPELDGGAFEADPERGSDNAIVLPAGVGLEVEEGEGERTQFDMVMDPVLVKDVNETIFDEDDGNETVMGDRALESELSAAQAELLHRLGELPPVTDNGATVDAEGLPDLTPSDLHAIGEEELEDDSATLHGDETINGPLSFNEATRDDTNINPMVIDNETEEDAFAAASVRSEGISDTVDAEDGGTIDDAPLPSFDLAAVRRSSMPPRPPPPLPNDQTPPPVIQEPSRARARVGVSQVQGRLTPRPVVERNHTQRPQESLGAPIVQGIAAEPGVGAGRRWSLGQPRLVMALAGGVGLLAAVLLVVVVTTMRPKSASLRIACEPAAVEVLLDGAYVGDTTPVVVPGLEVGPHRVELRAKGFAPYHQTIEIREPKPHTMQVDLSLMGEPLAPAAPEEELPMGDAAPDEGEGRAMR
ncbi:MAG: serine/threonine protein kinase [Myxococcales bacterium]|nr:serine/threonine protein kinase [Myxococcales bacterium]